MINKTMAHTETIWFSAELNQIFHTQASNKTLAYTKQAWFWYETKPTTLYVDEYILWTNLLPLDFKLGTQPSNDPNQTCKHFSGGGVQRIMNLDFASSSTSLSVLQDDRDDRDWQWHSGPVPSGGTGPRGGRGGSSDGYFYYETSSPAATGDKARSVQDL